MSLVRNPAIWDSAFWSRVGGNDVQYLSTKISTVINYIDSSCTLRHENYWEPLFESMDYLNRIRSKKKYKLVSCKVSMRVYNNGSRHKQLAYEYIIKICPMEVE